MRLLAISAQKRCGKDTAADYICSTGRYKKYALASPFKEKLCQYFGFTEDEINGVGFDRELIMGGLSGREVARRFKQIILDFGYSTDDIDNVDWSIVEECNEWSVRRLMQSIGTDIGCNQVDKLIWMHPMIKLYTSMIKEGNWDGLIISDCRQDHEMDIMRANNALVIHIENPNIVSEDSHITEAGLPKQMGDPVIINNFDPKYAEDEAYCRVKMEVFKEKIDKVLNEKVRHSKCA